MQLAQRTGLEIENDGRDRLGDRKVGGIHAPLAAALEDAVRLLGQYALREVE
jgi:hypothetical protein